MLVTGGSRGLGLLLARELAAEVAKDGIVVTTIVPGLMRTGSFLNALVKGRRGAEASLFSLASSLPLRRALHFSLVPHRGTP